jgi:hypothetical protein
MRSGPLGNLAFLKLIVPSNIDLSMEVDSRRLTFPRIMQENYTRGWRHFKAIFE